MNRTASPISQHNAHLRRPRAPRRFGPAQPWSPYPSTGASDDLAEAQDLFDDLVVLLDAELLTAVYDGTELRYTMTGSIGVDRGAPTGVSEHSPYRRGSA